MDTFLKILPATLVLVAVAMLLLVVRILLKRGGTFHSQHIGQSRAMRERGIHCVQAEDKLQYESKRQITDMEK